jgi:carboxymethylenebutenolidase
MNQALGQSAKRYSESIAIGEGAMPVYISLPTKQPAPAVIVLQEVFGINDEVKEITDLIAGSGYVGLAINVYHRSAPDLSEPFTREGLARASATIAPVTQGSIRTDVRAAVDWLNTRPAVRFGHVATWGFGATLGIVAATIPGVDAAIVFEEGSTVFDDDCFADIERIRAPLLLIFTAEDGETKPTCVSHLENALQAANKSILLQRYPPAEKTRGFGVSAFPAAIIADAWDLVQAFLQRTML